MSGNSRIAMLKKLGKALSLGILIFFTLIMVIKAQEKITSSTEIISPTILTDQQKITILNLQKKQTEDLASKYAKLYDSCKNK